MQVKTKYNLGEELFYLNENKKIRQESVSSATMFVRKDHISVSYTMGELYVGDSIDEKYLFETKKELIDSLDDLDEES